MAVEAAAKNRSSMLVMTPVEGGYRDRKMTQVAIAINAAVTGLHSDIGSYFTLLVR